MKLTITDFDFNNKKIYFKTPLSLDVVRDENGYYIDDDFLDLHCFGLTKRELKEELNEELQEIYQGCVLFEDDELSGGGIQLKEHLISLIK